MILDVVLPGVLLLGLVIFVHELGHFLAAKWRGVRVLRFSLGMGPELAGFTRGDTRYSLAWIPLGGYVQMAGDSVRDDGSLPDGGRDEFLSHPWFGRIVIAAAGPFANLVLAFVTLFVMCMVGITQPDFPNVLGVVDAGSAAARAGFERGDRLTHAGGRAFSTWRGFEDALEARERSAPLVIEGSRAGAARQWTIPAAEAREVLQGLGPEASPPVVGAVLTGMPAYVAGLQDGDRIAAVDGQPISDFGAIAGALAGKAEQRVRFAIVREGRSFDVDVKPIQGNPDDPRSAIIGIEAPRGMTRVQHFTPLEAVGSAGRGTIGLVVTVAESQWLTITQFLRYREYVGGPVFIAQMARDAARKGLDHYLYLLALINIGIMQFNLLPIPLLDGGHILLALLQALRRRALSGRAYLNFQKVGLVFVGALFVLILSKDILRPFQRMRAVDQAPRETTTVEPGAR